MFDVDENVKYSQDVLERLDIFPLPGNRYVTIGLIVIFMSLCAAENRNMVPDMGERRRGGCSLRLGFDCIIVPIIHHLLRA